jgi:hypothetical protein
MCKGVIAHGRAAFDGRGSGTRSAWSATSPATGYRAAPAAQQAQATEWSDSPRTPGDARLTRPIASEAGLLAFVEHVFAADAERMLEEFRTELNSATFDARRAAAGLEAGPLGTRRAEVMACTA